MTRRKWRPSLALVVTAVLGVVLAIPLVVLFSFNFYSNRLIQQTEESLIAQAVVLAIQFTAAFEQAGGDSAGARPLPPSARPDPDAPLDPIFPGLTLDETILLPRRPDPQPALRPADPVLADIGARLAAITRATQLRTLAGFRITDRFGRVIGGSGEIGYSLAHIPEVRAALNGSPTAVLRRRVSDEPTPPLWSISRRSVVRVFFAMPVVQNDRVIGAVYLSRTPLAPVQQLYQERWVLLRALGIILAATLVVGVVFWRVLTRPIGLLMQQIDRISDGDRDAIAPLRHYGTSEVARLGQNFLGMAEALNRRADTVASYTAHVTHELKTPLTSILGATELLTDPDNPIPPDRQARFLHNIRADAERMTLLLDRLRVLAAARDVPRGGVARAQQAREALREAAPGLEVSITGDALPIPLTEETLRIVLGHLARNAAEHGAQHLTIDITAAEDATVIDVADDGQGISPNNRAQIFEPFFTTKRESGGTGMGLGIVEAMVRSAGGSIALADSDTGARFVIRFERND